MKRKNTLPLTNKEYAPQRPQQRDPQGKYAAHLARKQSQSSSICGSDSESSYNPSDDEQKVARPDKKLRRTSRNSTAGSANNSEASAATKRRSNNASKKTKALPPENQWEMLTVKQKSKKRIQWQKDNPGASLPVYMETSSTATKRKLLAMEGNSNAWNQLSQQEQKNLRQLYQVHFPNQDLSAHMQGVATRNFKDDLLIYEQNQVEWNKLDIGTQNNARRAWKAYRGSLDDLPQHMQPKQKHRSKAQIKQELEYYSTHPMEWKKLPTKQWDRYRNLWKNNMSGDLPEHMLPVKSQKSKKETIERLHLYRDNIDAWNKATNDQKSGARTSWQIHFGTDLPDHMRTKRARRSKDEVKAALEEYARNPNIWKKVASKDKCHERESWASHFPDRALPSHMEVTNPTKAPNAKKAPEKRTNRSTQVTRTNSGGFTERVARSARTAGLKRSYSSGSESSVSYVAV